MHQDHFVHPINAKGISKPLSALPKDLQCLKDDPYRSLAGFVRVAGGYRKTPAPFAEFQWADFFRTRIGAKALRKRFDRSVAKGVRLARMRRPPICRASSDAGRAHPKASLSCY